jgi:hypothetical protein
MLQKLQPTRIHLDRLLKTQNLQAGRDIIRAEVFDDQINFEPQILLSRVCQRLNQEESRQQPFELCEKP